MQVDCLQQYTQNTERIPHTYNKGDEALQLKPGIKRKYSSHKSDPYRVTKVYTNGTVIIAQCAKRQQISLRNIELLTRLGGLLVDPFCLLFFAVTISFCFPVLSLLNVC